MKLLTQEFLDQYPNAPEHMTELGALVFYRTYSRWIEEEQRRETWKEAVARAVDYNVSISLSELEKKNLPIPHEHIKIEAETLFDNIFNLRQFLSGRTHWIGGGDSGVADKFPLANFNCSFSNMEDEQDIVELFYLLLVGTGVGHKETFEVVEKFPALRDNFDLIHADYDPVPSDKRLENTELKHLDNGYTKIYVGDSKEGWVEALRTFLNILIKEEYKDVHTIKISYNSIRPKGERLKTFGGTASGHEPLKEMFEGFRKVLTNQIDPTLEPLERVDDKHVKLRPIHILDMANLIGNNVVVGGVRRTAEIALGSPDDWEFILAKYGINGLWTEEAFKRHESIGRRLNKRGVKPKWWDEVGERHYDEHGNVFNYGRPLHHRRMSNNSIVFESKPHRDFLNLIFEIMQGEGEPGFVNLESANKRRPNAEGLNPCAEILLDSHGVCNLTTVNVDAFVQWEERTEPDGATISGYKLDFQGLMQAQALSARAGIRMTCVDLEIDRWDDVQKRDRLIGTSLTGWYDAMDKLGYDEQQESNLLNMLADNVRMEGLKYSNALRIPTPLLDTTIKPEGTLSQVAGGVSPGLHRSHSEYYIRRIRMNSNDPLVKVAQELNWTVNPEVGTPGETYEERMENARTVVIDFPVHSGAKTTKDDVYVKEQFDTYFRFQEHYTAHNSSNTVHVRPDEWEEVEQIVWDNWDDFVGVSFLSYDGGSYELAPYEKITKEEYEELKSSMKDFSPEILQQFEGKELDKELAMEGAEACEGGACPIF